MRSSFVRNLHGKKIFGLGSFCYGAVVRRRRVIIVLAACVLVGIGVVAFWLEEREPKYDAKKLTEWCLQYRLWMMSGREQARVAINHIGTNGLPFLVEWLRYDRQTPKEQLTDAFEELKDRLRRSAGARNSLMEHTRAQIAEFGFEALATNATPAIPMLAKLMRDRASSPDTVRAAAHSLACTGEQGLLELARFLRDQGQSNRVYAVAGLARVQQNAEPALELLMEFIQGPDEQLAVASAGSLFLTSPEPEMRIAILRKGAADPRRAVRISSISSLANFGRSASAATSGVDSCSSGRRSRRTAGGNEGIGLDRAGIVAEWFGLIADS